MFSATLHSDAILRASETLCQNPIWVDLKGKDYVPDRVQQSVYYVDVTDREQYYNYDVNLCEKYTDNVHLLPALESPLTSKDSISLVWLWSIVDRLGNKESQGADCKAID